MLSRRTTAAVAAVLCLISFGAVACKGCGAKLGEPSQPGKNEFPASAGGPEYLPIKGGAFHYGCEANDILCREFEIPGKDVTVSDFEMTKMEITVDQYAACVVAGRCTEPGPGAGGKCNWAVDGKQRHPINCVNQAQAKAFCAWAGGRLPTSEEWEYAAKGGTKRVYPWGDTPPTQASARWSAEDGTAAVGSYPAGATPQGLLDMAGNVWEWTGDNFDPEMMEVRGGSWRNNDPRLLRASNRGRRPPNDLSDFLGFRCAR